MPQAYCHLVDLQVFIHSFSGFGRIRPEAEDSRTAGGFDIGGKSKTQAQNTFCKAVEKTGTMGGDCLHAHPLNEFERCLQTIKVQEICSRGDIEHLCCFGESKLINREGVKITAAIDREPVYDL